MTTDGNKSKKKTPSTTFHLLAGLASGFTSSILLQPADLLKTRVQQSGSTSLLATLRLIRSQPNPVKQLWRGTLPSVIRTSFGSALYFTSLNAFRTTLAKREIGVKNSTISDGTQDVAPQRQQQQTSSSLPQLTTLANLTSGAVARSSVGFIMMPITVIKVRYESSYYAYTSIVSAARDIGAREGLRGFFAGFGATALRDAPYAGLYVVFYEWGKRTLSGLATGEGSETVSATGLNADGLSTSAATGDTPSSLLSAADSARSSTSISPVSAAISPTMSASINFTSSTLAASLSTALTNPPDAIKTRLQLRPEKYKHTLQALRLMLKEEGVRSLFDGLALRMARKAMSSALAWTVYEELTRRASNIVE